MRCCDTYLQQTVVRCCAAHHPPTHVYRARNAFVSRLVVDGGGITAEGEKATNAYHSDARTFSDGSASADLKTSTLASPEPPSAVVTRRVNKYVDRTLRLSLGRTTIQFFMALACWRFEGSEQRSIAFRDTSCTSTDSTVVPHGFQARD